MRLRKILMVVALFGLLASCRKADPVIGKWEEAEGNGWTEYFADGDVILNDGGKSTSGTWKRLEDGRIKVDTVVRGSNTAEVYQVSIGESSAIFTSTAGTVKAYRRSGVAASAEKDPWSEINPRQALDRQAQRRTVADIRLTGTAMFSWLTDQIGAGAAGQSQTEKPGSHVDLMKYSRISRAELARILVPKYVEKVPELDGWGYPYEYYLNVSNPLAPMVMSIRSPGRDGVFSSTEYNLGPFDPDDFYEDIVWSDGFFVRWPQKKER